MKRRNMLKAADLRPLRLLYFILVFKRYLVVWRNFFFFPELHRYKAKRVGQSLMIFFRLQNLPLSNFYCFYFIHKGVIFIWTLCWNLCYFGILRNNKSTHTQTDMYVKNKGFIRINTMKNFFIFLSFIFCD